MTSARVVSLVLVVVLVALLAPSRSWPTKRIRTLQQTQAPSAPWWPTWWNAELVQFSNISSPPPYKGFPNGKTTRKSNMKSFYDWTDKSFCADSFWHHGFCTEQVMIEQYESDCVPIFEDYPMPFGCQFHNGYDHATYLLTGDDRPKGFPGPCCLFAKPWFPPPPNFAALYMWFSNSHSFNGRDVNSFTMDTGDVGGGPFFYDFYSSNSSAPIPAMFAFPGLSWPNGNVPYIAQFYVKFSSDKPDPSMFETPEVCKGNIPSCPTPGGISVTLAPPHSGHNNCIYPSAPQPAPQPE